MTALLPLWTEFAPPNAFWYALALELAAPFALAILAACRRRRARTIALWFGAALGAMVALNLLGNLCVLAIFAHALRGGG